MIARAPAGAPWVSFVRQAIAALGEPGSGPPAADAAGMTAEQREMARGMVERLAARLAADGSDVEGWLRLVRSYMVLGEQDKARAAASDARRALAGDTLVVLDDRDLRARLAQIDADLAALLATVSSRARVGQAEAAVAQAQANNVKAQADLARIEPLVVQNIVSSQQLDAARAAAAAASAQLASAQAALVGADARVASARAARDQAALQLSYTRILAPAAGVVSKKSVEIGQLVAPGQPLMTVVPLDDVWVTANLKETETADVTPGDSADITVDAYGGRHVRGHVESLSPATGAKFSLLPPDNATGNFTKVVQRIPVRIRLDSPADAAHPLRPGMSVVATIKTH